MRPPTTEEKSELLKFLAQRSSRREETLAGLVWAIINSREFAYNHWVACRLWRHMEDEAVRRSWIPFVRVV